MTKIFRRLFRWEHAWLVFLVAGLGALAFYFLSLATQNQHSSAAQPFPSIADIGYLMTEPLICVGLLLFIRKRHHPVGMHLLDAAIFTIALGFPIYAFL